MWEGIRAITDYKKNTSPSAEICAILTEDLNLFYTRFDRDNNGPIQSLMPSSDTAPVLNTHEVRICLHNINPRKVAGPDGFLGRALKDCAAELPEIFTTIFNISLSSACLKTATIVPVPKTSRLVCLNDYRPVALTPILAKCLERLVMNHIKNSIPSRLDQYQFAYRKIDQQKMPLLLRYTLCFNI